MDNQIILRDYQNKGVQLIRNFFKKGGNHAIFRAPTGGGKTIIFSYIAQNVALKKKKVLILTNRSELLMQADGSLSKFGLKPFLIRAGINFLNFNSNAYIAMSQTLRNRVKKDMWKNWIKKIDLIIIDEAHLQDFNFLFESGLIDNVKTLGFTATPKRTGKMRQLAIDYEEILGSVEVSELIDRNYLVPDDYFGVQGVNLNNVKFDYMKGDYSEQDMFNRFNSPKLYAGVVKNWLQIAPNSHTIVFCVNVEHCIHTCEEFQKNGIDARFITSAKTKPKEPEENATEGDWIKYEEKMRLYNLYIDNFAKWSGNRADLFRKFNNKEFTVLINAGIATTGFDCPAIETVIVNRATTSQTLWLQMIGRGSRTFPGKTHFNILDFGDNASRLGHYTQNQAWSLWHEMGKESDGEGVPPVKECGENRKPDKNGKKGCGRIIMASLKICPFCGYITPKSEAKEIDLSGIMYDNKLHRAVAVKKISDMDIDELYDYFKLKKHKSAWLWRQLYFRGGEDLIEKIGKQKGWKLSTVQKSKEFCKRL
ncbi:MAG: DEAD/DEAH box helicase family protein [Vicingaceae bacterium]